MCVKQVVTELLRHAGAAVVGGAAADADDEVPRALVVAPLQELTDAIGRRNPRVAFRRWHEGQPRGLRHLDYGTRSGVDQAVLGIDGIVHRPAPPRAPSFA